MTTTSEPSAGQSVAAIGRLDLPVLELLWREAKLLDQWRLREWAELFTEDGRYLVPATDRPDGSPTNTLMLIDDDISRIHARVHRLLSRDAHADYPRPRTRRLVTNILVTPDSSDDPAAPLEVTASFIVYSFRVHRVHTFVGGYRYQLARTGDGLKIAEKRVELDLEDLVPAGGKINLII